MTSLRRRLGWVLVAAMAAPAVLAACGGDDDSATAASPNGSSGKGGKGGSSGSSGGSAGQSGASGKGGGLGGIGQAGSSTGTTYASLAISPPGGTITFVNGTAKPSASIAFTVQGTTTDGKTSTLSDVTWAIDKTKLATVDDKGNVSATVVRTVRRDPTPPKVRASVTRDGRHAVLRLVATDPESGIAAVRYRVDGGAWRSYEHRVRLTGRHVVEFRAVDGAGLSSAIGRRSVSSGR